MANERQNLDNHQAKRDVPQSEDQKPGATVVTARWLIHRKPSTKKVKARFVARQVKRQIDGMDTYAATSSALTTRLIIALVEDRI